MLENSLDIVVGQLQPIITSQKFVKQDSEECVYANSTCAFRISYDADRHVYLLDKADLSESKESEFYNISSYLFDDSSTENDAKSVGNDFHDTLNNELGIVKSVAMTKRDVKLPTKAKGDATPGIDGFCSRFLTLFPVYKDKYKDDVARYNGFLPDNFFSNTAAVVLRNAVSGNDTKQFNKLVTMLDQYYVDGDYEVQSTITYSIIGEAFRENLELFEKFESMLTDEHSHIKMPAKNMIKFVISKGK